MKEACVRVVLLGHESDDACFIIIFATSDDSQELHETKIPPFKP